MLDDLIYLFLGDAEIFIQNRINRIISSLGKKTYTIFKYDMETVPMSNILEELMTVPFLEDLKVVILRNPSILKQKDISKKEENFIKYIKKPNNTTLLIIDGYNCVPNQANPIYKELKLNSVIIEYNKGELVETKGWIKKTIENADVAIDDEAIDKLFDYVGDDQVRMVNEMDKLIQYAKGKEKITVKDIDKLVSPDFQNQVYALVTSIVKKDKDAIHNTYNLLKANTKDVMGLIALITKNIKDLLQVLKLTNKGYAQSDIAKMFDMSSGRAYYFINDAKAFGEENLMQAVKRLAELDYQIKTGAIDKETGIELFLLKI